MSNCRKLINQWLRESISKALSRKFSFFFFLSLFQQRWSGFSHPEDGAFNKSRILSRRNRRHATSNGTHRRKKRAGSTRRRPDSLFYLIPLHGGIWHLCVDLQSKEK
jgi:hypothetical protein